MKRVKPYELKVGQKYYLYAHGSSKVGRFIGFAGNNKLIGYEWALFEVSYSMVGKGVGQSNKGSNAKPVKQTYFSMITHPGLAWGNKENIKFNVDAVYVA